MSDEKLSKQFIEYLRQNHPDACLDCGRRMDLDLNGNYVCIHCIKVSQ